MLRVKLENKNSTEKWQKKHTKKKNDEKRDLKI